MLLFVSENILYKMCFFNFLCMYSAHQYMYIFHPKRAILLKNRSKHYLWIESWRRNPSARLLSDQDRISKLRPFISHVPRLEPRTSAFFLRCKVQLAVPSKSSQDLVVVMKFEFCAHSARLLRKLDHVFLWILSNDTGLWQCSVEKSKENSND